MERSRPPTVAGLFYPEDPEELRSVLEKYLLDAVSSSTRSQKTFPQILIAPHAGYIYSGPVAAHAYQSIKGGDYDVVIVLAPSHRVSFTGMAVSSLSLKTPLGLVPTDEDIVKTLLNSGPPFLQEPSIHTGEHSAEVHFPFLQTLLPHAKVVEIIIGQATLEDCQTAARTLQIISEQKGARLLLVASTDLSHYHPYDEAVMMDRRTIDFIESLDAARLLKEDSRGSIELCGLLPVCVVCEYARMKGGSRAELLYYANSGDTAGDKKQVVGYASLRIDLPEGEKERNHV